MIPEKTKVPVKKIGLWILTTLVAGNMIGSGIFLLPSALASYGSIGILAWILTAVGAIFLCLVFAQLSRIIPRVGGPYAYCYAGFGEFIGFLVAYNYWIAVWVGNAAIAVAFIGYLSVFWPHLVQDHVFGFMIAVSAVWLVTIINILGVRFAGIVQLITTLLKVLPLLLLACLGIFFIRGEDLIQNFNVTQQPLFGALTSAAALTLWSFVGLESATVPAEAVENPERNISRATILGTSITAIIYIVSTIAVMGIVPLEVLQHSTAPYADAAHRLIGPWAKWFVAGGAVIACFGALNGWTLLQGQVPYAAARDKLFPRAFAKKSKNGTPYVGLIISSVFITILLTSTLDPNLVKQFTFIILLATLSSLIPYFITASAQLMLIVKRREFFNSKRIVATTLIGIIAMLYAFWAIAGAGMEILYYGSLLMFTSVPVYVWMKWRNTKHPDYDPDDEVED